MKQFSNTTSSVNPYNQGNVLIGYSCNCGALFTLNAHREIMGLQKESNDDKEHIKVTVDLQGLILSKEKLPH